MKYKAGDIIFLTRRKKGGYRGFISRSIARMTKFKDQYIEDVKVHSAIIYDHFGDLFVRDMDMKGNERYTLDYYIEKYKDRIEIYEHSKSLNNVDIFNKSCLNKKVKYDYSNTFFFQVVKVVTSKWIGKNTPYKRMCAEDVQRQFNILRYTFNYPEQTNPNQLYKYCVSRGI